MVAVLGCGVALRIVSRRPSLPHSGQAGARIHFCDGSPGFRPGLTYAAPPFESAAGGLSG